MSQGSRVAGAIIGSIAMLAGVAFLIRHKDEISKMGDDFLSSVTTQVTAPAAPTAPAAGAPPPPQSPPAAGPPATAAPPPITTPAPSSPLLPTDQGTSPPVPGVPMPSSPPSQPAVDTSGPPIATPPVDVGGAKFPEGSGTLWQKPTPASWFPKSTYVPPPPPPVTHPAAIVHPPPGPGTVAHPTAGVKSCVVGTTRYPCDHIPCSVGQAAIEGACKFACGWSQAEVDALDRNCQTTWHPLHPAAKVPLTSGPRRFRHTALPPPTRGPCADGSWPDAQGNCKPIPVYLQKPKAGFYYGGGRVAKEKAPRGGYY